MLKRYKETQKVQERYKIYLFAILITAIIFVTVQDILLLPQNGNKKWKYNTHKITEKDFLSRRSAGFNQRKVTLEFQHHLSQNADTLDTIQFFVVD